MAGTLISGVEEAGAKAGAWPNAEVAKTMKRSDVVSSEDIAARDDIAALPPHMAESLRLSGQPSNPSEATPRFPRGVASLDLISIATGKPEAFRHVRRQSREKNPCGNDIIKPRLVTPNRTQLLLRN